METSEIFDEVNANTTLFKEQIFPPAVEDEVQSFGIDAVDFFSAEVVLAVADSIEAELAGAADEAEQEEWASCKDEHSLYVSCKEENSFYSFEEAG